MGRNEPNTSPPPRQSVLDYRTPAGQEIDRADQRTARLREAVASAVPGCLLVAAVAVLAFTYLVLLMRTQLP